MTSPPPPRTTRKVRSTGTDEPTTKWEAVLSYLGRNPGAPVARTVLEALSNPLMTSLARAAYGDTDADPRRLLEPQFADLPTLEEHLLDAFVPAVYLGRPAATGMPSTGAGAGCSPEQAREWLSRLAVHLNELGTRDLAWWRVAPGPCRGLPDAF